MPEGAPLLYFAYGSNMAGPRLAARIGTMRKVGVAALDAHRLAFHKVSHDGSGKCDIAPAPDGQVWGVVFEIATAHQVILDRYEGLGQGYERKQVTLSLVDGARLTAFSYYATQVDPAIRPYPWYKAHVLRGATEHGLPADYISRIASVATMLDLDIERVAREEGLYR